MEVNAKIKDVFDVYIDTRSGAKLTPRGEYKDGKISEIKFIDPRTQQIVPHTNWIGVMGAIRLRVADGVSCADIPKLDVSFKFVEYKCELENRRTPVER